MSLYGLSSFKLFWDRVLDIKALLAWNRDTAVLAFRGTVSLTNACSDLQVLHCCQCVYTLGLVVAVHHPSLFSMDSTCQQA